LYMAEEKELKKKDGCLLIDTIDPLAREAAEAFQQHDLVSNVAGEAKHSSQEAVSAAVAFALASSPVILKVGDRYKLVTGKREGGGQKTQLVASLALRDKATTITIGSQVLVGSSLFVFVFAVVPLRGNHVRVFVLPPNVFALEALEEKLVTELSISQGSCPCSEATKKHLLAICDAWLEKWQREHAPLPKEQKKRKRKEDDVIIEVTPMTDTKIAQRRERIKRRETQSGHELRRLRKQLKNEEELRQLDDKQKMNRESREKQEEKAKELTKLCQDLSRQEEENVQLRERLKEKETELQRVEVLLRTAQAQLVRLHTEDGERTKLLAERVELQLKVATLEATVKGKEELVSVYQRLSRSTTQAEEVSELQHLVKISKLRAELGTLHGV